MTIKAVLKGSALVLMCVLCTTLVSARTRGVSSAGELFLQDPESLALETRGEPVHDGAVVRTGTEAGIVRLEDHAPLRLDPNSAVVFESGPSRVWVHVLSGRASVVGPSGRILTGGADSRFTLPEAELDADLAERMLLEQAPLGRRER